MADDLKNMSTVFADLDSWTRTVNAFKREKITSYTVDPSCVEFVVKDGVIYIPPEAERVVAEIIKEANHI